MDRRIDRRHLLIVLFFKKGDVSMKTLPKVLLAGIFALILCIVSAVALFCYGYPMDDKSYNLSLLSEDGEPWRGEIGWTVYINNQGQHIKLKSLGNGAYSGLTHPGQTIYYSRTMEEKLDSPTLRIDAVNRSVSVFLDDRLVYTDCPDLDNRIGWLELPMLDYDRLEPVVVSLPFDYVGRTLTIAQSTPIHSEKQADTGEVFPCGVTLYCGYSYESGLIASTSRIMIPATLLFSLIVLLWAVFIQKASYGRIVIALPIIALAAFFQMCGILAKAPFFLQYFGTFSVDLILIFFHLSVSALLAFLIVKAERFRLLLSIVTLIQVISIIASAFAQAKFLIPYSDFSLFLVYLPQAIGFFALITASICAVIQWRHGNRFFRTFSHTALVLIGGFILSVLIESIFRPDHFSAALHNITEEISMMMPNKLLKLLWGLCLISSIIALVVELVKQEAQRRTELSILETRNKLALESYENLRRQSEEVMMLRHDTTKHYTLLRSMAVEAPGRLPAYLDALIGQIQQIRPVVASGNQILDILVNGELSVALEKGIQVKIIRSEAPPKLPLLEAELCSLIMNILDNAIAAASAPEITQPYIKLDFHCKGEHFVFSCENSMSYQTNKKIPMPEHGYGLKIIRQIMKNWGEMVSIESNGTTFKLSIAIPLN